MGIRDEGVPLGYARLHNGVSMSLSRHGPYTSARKGQALTMEMIVDVLKSSVTEHRHKDPQPFLSRFLF